MIAWTQLKLLSRFPLAPVLVRQGQELRKTAVRLPEAAGPRRGQSGQELTTKPMRVLILGDSAAAGVGVSQQEYALAGCLARELEQDRSYAWALWAKSGDTTAHTLVKLHLQPAEQFDYVIISLGVNDATSQCSLSTFLRRQRALYRRLRASFGVHRVLVTEVPPMQYFDALPQPLRWYMGQRARLLNQGLARLIAREPACELVQVNFPTERQYMAEDGFHPSAIGYRHWAQALAQRLRQLP